ncbi:MAG: helix-turn-helix domain-containing protein [Verrucomicrobiota bacterium]
MTMSKSNQPDPPDAREDSRRIVPCALYDSNDLPKEDAFAVWHDLCQPVMEVTPRQPSAPYNSSFKFYPVGDLIINRTHYAASMFERKSGHIRAGDRDFLALHFFLKGSEQVNATGHVFEMSPRSVCLHDWTTPFYSESTATEQLGVLIPSHLLEMSEFFREREPALSWSLDSAPGKILAEAMTGIWQNLPSLEASETVDVSAGLIGLINGLMKARWEQPSDDGVVQRATLYAMKKHLMRHLGDPSLGVDSLVEAFHCSRSGIYRLFAEVGGVKTFVQQQRLAACYRDLATTAPQLPQKIAGIAARWGFVDRFYFQRIFKQRYGLTPGDLISAMGERTTIEPSSQEQSTHDRIMDFHTWIGYRPDANGKMESAT